MKLYKILLALGPSLVAAKTMAQPAGLAPAGTSPPPVAVGTAANTTEQALTLPTVLALVTQRYPLLKAAFADQAAAEAELLNAEGQFDVTWKTRAAAVPLGYYQQVRADTVIEKPTDIWGSSFFAGYKLGLGDFASYDGKLQTLDFGEIRAGGNLPLWRNRSIDRRRASRSRAELGVELANLTVRQQQIELRRAASVRYWAWVAAGRRLAFAERLLKIAVDRDAGIAGHVGAGNAADIDRIDNERAIAQRSGQVTASRRALEQAAIELSLLLRDASGAPMLPRADQLPPTLLVEAAPLPTSADKDSAVAVQQRPEARRLDLQALQQRIEMKWAENQRAPGLDLQLMVSQDFGAALEGRPDLSKPVLEAMLVLEIPLQTRFMQGRIDQARALQRRLQLQASFATDRIKADVADAHSALRAARERINAAGNEVKAALALEEGERNRFDLGYSTLLIVNIREQQTAEAQLREIDAQFEYCRALADLAAARGEM